MGPNNRQHGPGELDRVQNCCADFWVLLDLFKLLIGQAAGLEQDILRDTQLADIVQKCAGVDRLQLHSIQSHMLRGGDGITLHPQNMLMRILIFCVDRQR